MKIDLKGENFLQNDTPYKWLKKIGKERVQAFQDSFAKSFEISLCLLGLNGEVLTVWSNSLMFCHYMMKINGKRCLQERKNAINHVIKNEKPHIFKCYMGLTLFMCPIYYCREITCIAMGGGVFSAEDKDNTKKLADSNIPILANKKVEDIIDLLGATFNMLNCEEELQESDNKGAQVINIGLLQNRLSRRELEIADLITDGMTNKEISKKLYISEKTVKTHVSNILAKLEMKDRMQLVLFCSRNKGL